VPAIAIFIICASWLLVRERTVLQTNVTSNKNIVKIFLVLFLILFSISILCVYFRDNLYERPIGYFVLVSIMSGFIGIQILSSNKLNFNSVILAEIILLGLNILWTQQLIFPDIIGIDPNWHQMFTNILINEGHIKNGYTYSGTPFLHIEVGVSSLILNEGYKIASLLSITFIYVVLMCLCTYLLGKLIFNEQISLMGTLFLTIGVSFIAFGWLGIPNSLGGVLLLLLVFIIFKLINYEGKKIFLIFLAIFVILIVTIILSHSFSALVLGLITIITYLIFLFFNKWNPVQFPQKISLLLPILFWIIMLAWWIFGVFVFNTMFELLRGLFEDSSVTTPELISDVFLNSVPLYEQFANNLGLFIISAGSIFGFLIILKNKMNPLTFTISIIGLFCLSLGFLGTVITYVGSGRWIFFSQIFLPLIFALCLFLLPIEKYFKTCVVIIFIVTFSYSFVSISNNVASIDNHFFSPNSGIRLAFIESEIQAASFANQKSTATIASDFDYSANPSSTIFFNKFAVPMDRLLALDQAFLSRTYDHDESLKIIRMSIVGPPFRLRNGIIRLNYDPNDWLSNMKFSRIYDNQMVKMYV
jgi:hypothetical protein